MGSWSTSQNTYGDFLDGWDRTFLPRLHSSTKNQPESQLANMPRRPYDPLRDSTTAETTADDYGNFYQSNQSRSGRVEYKISSSALPPITAGYQASQRDPKYYRDFFAPKVATNKDILILPDIKTVDVQLHTRGMSTVTMYPNRYGGVGQVVEPKWIDTVSLPEITDISLKIKKHDGSEVTVRARPDYYTTL